MKQILFLSFLSVLAVIILAALIAPPPAPQVPDPSPPIRSDSEITFTVLHNDTVETVCMSDYLPGVLAGEMPALFETQALMAQAVAARTYILHRMQKGSANHPHADICNDPACCKAYVSVQQMQENWGSNFDSYYAKIAEAAANTDGQHLTYQGELIEAVFHSSSAGATEASGSIWNDRPYLVSVDSPESASDVPNYISQVSLSADLLKQQLRTKYPDLDFSADPNTWLSGLRHNDSGRVQSLQVCGTELSGAQLRSVLGLRSTAFTVDFADGTFTFTVTGYGHGVGMSQYGANVFAKQGLDYRQILAHYYPNTQLTSAAG